MGDGAPRMRQAQGLTDARKKLIFNEYILYSIWKRILYYIPERVLFFPLTFSLQRKRFYCHSSFTLENAGSESSVACSKSCGWGQSYDSDLPHATRFGQTRGRGSCLSCPPMSFSSSLSAPSTQGPNSATHLPVRMSLFCVCKLISP